MVKGSGFRVQGSGCTPLECVGSVSARVFAALFNVSPRRANLARTCWYLYLSLSYIWLSLSYIWLSLFPKKFTRLHPARVCGFRFGASFRGLIQCFAQTREPRADLLLNLVESFVYLVEPFVYLVEPFVYFQPAALRSLSVWVPFRREFWRLCPRWRPDSQTSRGPVIKSSSL